MLCSTDPAVARTAKFRMDFTTRTYQTDDLSVKSMGYKLDGKGYGGMFLPKKEVLWAITARAISHTMARIGREALPFSEKVKYVLHGGKYKRVQASTSQTSRRPWITPACTREGG